MLVNNAGISHEFGQGTRPSDLDLATLKATYETNVFGAFTVIKAMLPLLKRSAPSARIINQSSTLGSLGVLSDPGRAVLRRQHPAGLQLVEVGPERPDGGARQGPGRGPDLGQLDLPRMGQDRHGLRRRPRTVEQGAAIAVKLATMDDPPTGKYLDDNGEIPW